MGILFWLAKPRNLLLLAGMLIFLRYWPDIETASRRWYNVWRYPPQRAAGASGKDIMDKLEERQARKILLRHNRIDAALQKAKEEGFDVAGLQAKSNAAMTLNNPIFREQAVNILNEIEMALPHTKQR